MDKFLEITFENQILATKDGGKFVEYFAPFMEKLKGIVSAELYEEFDELLNGLRNELCRMLLRKRLKLISTKTGNS